MRFQLSGHSWPINGGAHLIPVGTILDAKNWTWRGISLPPLDKIPLNAVALDQEGWDHLCNVYSDRQHLLMKAIAEPEPERAQENSNSEGDQR